MAISAPAPSLPPGHHVTVVLPRVGSLPATVEATEPGAVVVALAVADTRVHRLGGHEVAVESISGRGIQRFTGTLELSLDRPEILRIRIAGEAERIQRREWVRVDAIVPVTVTPIDEEGGGATTTANISGGGLMVKDPWNLPLGTDVRFELEAGAERVAGLARVVRAVEGHHKGLRIDNLSRADEDRLIRFVRERELSALRMARGR
jgi:hypothetical protein